jgi:hypothetical protein
MQDSDGATQNPAASTSSRSENDNNNALNRSESFEAGEEIIRCGPQLPDAPSSSMLFCKYEEDVEVGPDFLERQVLARKTNASTSVSKLVCDEVCSSRGLCGAIYRCAVHH